MHVPFPNEPANPRAAHNNHHQLQTSIIALLTVILCLEHNGSSSTAIFTHAESENVWTDTMPGSSQAQRSCYLFAKRCASIWRGSQGDRRAQQPAPRPRTDRARGVEGSGRHHRGSARRGEGFRRCQ